MQRILIVTKFRFIGDTLLAIPVFRAARQQWPQAEVTLLTGRNARVLLQHTPLLDEILEFDPRGRDRGGKQFLGLVNQVRRARYDLCLVLNRSFHSALIPALAGVPLRAGFRSEGRSCLLNRNVDYDQEKSEIACYFDVLRAVAPTVPTDPTLELWLSPAEHQEALQRLRNALGEDGGASLHLIGIQPGASLPEKRWEMARFAQTADLLVRSDSQKRLVLIGGPEERPVADAMLAQCAPHTRTQIVDFVGHTDLRQTLALIAHLHLFLGNDTAILHSANALGVPTVALFGPTNPRKWGAQGKSHRILQASDGCMDSISVEAVVNALQELQRGFCPGSSSGNLERLPRHS